MSGRPHLRKGFSSLFQAPKGSDCTQEPCAFPPLGSDAVHSSEDICVWTYWRRVVIWKWLDCPFCCHIMLLGVSGKKVGPGETGERTRLHVQSILPVGEASHFDFLLWSLRQCCTWQYWIKPLNSSCSCHWPCCDGCLAPLLLTECWQGIAGCFLHASSILPKRQRLSVV